MVAKKKKKKYTETVSMKHDKQHDKCALTTKQMLPGIQYGVHFLTTSTSPIPRN